MLAHSTNVYLKFTERKQETTNKNYYVLKNTLIHLRRGKDKINVFVFMKVPMVSQTWKVGKAKSH